MNQVERIRATELHNPELKHDRSSRRPSHETPTNSFPELERGVSVLAFTRPHDSDRLDEVSTHHQRSPAGALDLAHASLEVRNQVSQGSSDRRDSDDRHNHGGGASSLAELDLQPVPRQSVIYEVEVVRILGKHS